MKPCDGSMDTKPTERTTPEKIHGGRRNGKMRDEASALMKGRRASRYARLILQSVACSNMSGKLSIWSVLGGSSPTEWWENALQRTSFQMKTKWPQSKNSSPNTRRVNSRDIWCPGTRFRHVRSP